MGLESILLLFIMLVLSVAMAIAYLIDSYDRTGEE
jgi:hypothetical protein